MPDKTITCVECGNEFNFSAEEQDFYNERGFQEPKRCKDCRERRKRQRSEQGGHGYNR
ncbi:zinc-ribbon domain-containing protein [bacterium]|nr:zinc-ribbon domain-containing protein [bacterium]